MVAEIPSKLIAIEQGLKQLGYQEPSGAVVRNYDFVVSRGKVIRADLLAFADPRRHDVSTSCIAVKMCSNGHTPYDLLKDISYVGAPLAIFAHQDFVEFCPVTSPNARHPDIDHFVRVSYEGLPGYISSLKPEFSPRQVINAKKGEWQPSFFYIDPSLDAFARNATREALVAQFEDAMSATLKWTNGELTTQLVRLAIWILAARILQDKLVDDPGLKTNDILSLFRTLRERFGNYFHGLQDDLAVLGIKTAEILYDRLRGDFTFRSLTNDMLAYFYENTLVSPDLRRQLGIYYTPRTIAELLLQRLPVEDIPLEKRYIFDGTCGSGNLLLAGYDRLTSLLPAKWSAPKRHRYLLNHIWGVDKDVFATEVARLSLLLYDLPQGDSWKIKSGDVFHINPTEDFGGRPSIIVGNPPYGESRPVGGRRIQTAAQVLEKYFEWLTPGGLLGVVVPMTLLETTSSAEVRRTLSENFDILEIWRLPENTISSSSSPIAVILAKKLEFPRIYSFRKPELVRVDEVFRNQREDFLRFQKPTISYFIDKKDWFFREETSMVSTVFSPILSRVERSFLPISPFYLKIVNGVKIGPENRRTHLSTVPKGPNWRPALIRNTKGRTLQPFRINWESQGGEKYILYPGKLERPRTPEHFQVSPKVVINGARNSSSPWRIYAAIDRNRLIVTENFYYGLPQNADVEVIVALLNSMMVNALVANNTFQWNLTSDTLAKIPFPKFTAEQESKIHKLLQNKVEIDLFEQIDEIVFDAYGVTEEERRKIKKYMSLFPRPGDIARKPSADFKEEFNFQGKVWKVTGEVESIESSEKFTIWVEGRGREVMPVPSNMPGWGLREGAAFTAIIPWEQRKETDLREIKWINFFPVEFGYLSEQEIISYLMSGGERDDE